MRIYANGGHSTLTVKISLYEGLMRIYANGGRQGGTDARGPHQKGVVAVDGRRVVGNQGYAFQGLVGRQLLHHLLHILDRLERAAKLCQSVKRDYSRGRRDLVYR